MAPPPLIIHPGFHRTGTTAIQHALDANSAALVPWRVLLKRDIPELCAAARDHARRPGGTSLARFTAVAAALAREQPTPTLISAEDLCGLIPGRKGRRGYPAAAALLAALIDALPGYVPQIYLTTRAPDDWLKSCHAHHLRHTRHTDDLATYRAQQAGAEPEMMALDIAAQLGPVPVTIVALHTTAALPHGPLTPLLDLMHIPQTTRDGIRPVPRANAALPTHLLDALLELNQSDLNPETLAIRKRALIADYRRNA